ncbi:MAG: competence/damage-inducible protein A [Kiritimatiellales bacterium]|nr:competence/damage-inducible protein A [Kiritimatiellota bacterium]MBL7012297.1 competence/damage-inducible protein A [Kiritimatiellales bacterium]
MKNSIELISIGTELLSGRTLNTHAQTLGAVLSEIGLSLSRDTTIPDSIKTIQSAVREAFERVDIVIVSGGLGPTSDDITREALAALFNRDIVSSPSALEEIKKRYAARGYPMNPASERMALIIEGAETLINSAGAAAAQRLDPETGKTLFVVPGPPNEFAAVLNDHIVPWLRKNFPDAVPLELRVLTTQGIGESAIVTLLENSTFQCSPALPVLSEAEGRELEGELSIGFYPGFGRVEIRLTAPKKKAALLDQTERTLRKLLHDHLID